MRTTDRSRAWPASNWQRARASTSGKTDRAPARCRRGRAVRAGYRPPASVLGAHRCDTRSPAPPDPPRAQSRHPVAARSKHPLLCPIRRWCGTAGCVPSECRSGAPARVPACRVPPARVGTPPCASGHRRAGGTSPDTARSGRPAGSSSSSRPERTSACDAGGSRPRMPRQPHTAVRPTRKRFAGRQRLRTASPGP